MLCNFLGASGERIAGVALSVSKYTHAPTASLSTILHLIGANPVSTPRQAYRCPHRLHRRKTRSPAEVFDSEREDGEKNCLNDQHVQTSWQPAASEVLIMMMREWAKKLGHIRWHVLHNNISSCLLNHY